MIRSVKVISISGNTFDWNENTNNEGSDTGVIAQEIEALGLPGLVTTRDNGYKAVRYEKLVPLLVEAIKELSGKVDALEQKNYPINNSENIIMANIRKSFNFSEWCTS